MQKGQGEARTCWPRGALGLVGPCRGLWTGAGHGSTGSTVDRNRKTGERTAQGAGRGGGAMAVAGELAVGALQGKAGCSEGTVA